MIRKVGTKLPSDPRKYFTYPMCVYDEFGYADATLFHPIDYDLLYLKIEGKSETVRGWCAGNHWDGFHLQEGDKILKWKKARDEQENI